MLYPPSIYVSHEPGKRVRPSVLCHGSISVFLINTQKVCGIFFVIILFYFFCFSRPSVLTDLPQELSPNPPSVKSGAPSNASSNLSRQGNGTFQPPVGRFPGEGGQWTSEQPRSANGSASRTQASGGADGLSNYVGGTLNRRSNTPGRPPVAGACGLVNLGNTCYLNSAVQCLSHTPLVRAYLLSDMWAAEVNKYNPLGTQVR